MKKILILIAVVAVIALTAPTVFAVNETVGKTATPGQSTVGKAKAAKQQAPKTRQEAITQTKERLTKLEAMSDAEWLANQNKKPKARARLNPAERKNLKEKFKEQPKS